jgi:hypothetical protein
MQVFDAFGLCLIASVVVVVVVDLTNLDPEQDEGKDKQSIRCRGTGVRVSL